MKRRKLGFGKGFRVALTGRKAQVATMVLAPGETEGGPDNHHRADQWLFVVSGSGEAIINKKLYTFSSGTLLLIEAGDFHEIRNSGSSPLKTLNFYQPPAYKSTGVELSAGRG